ncbi:hypothetical protein TPA0910_11500 [Streptomyces hygroscopicus subsp. sporocinereus]|uniref:Uncharacterized protein n=1 Tax=Streptomyces hygroscopicus TaxID=1912 RepID=A0ABQ3TTQ6_STRHY|nr:hypothetical protein TPA0910_11500 [Streptomyces hygroscopicus]
MRKPSTGDGHDVVGGFDESGVREGVRADRAVGDQDQRAVQIQPSGMSRRLRATDWDAWLVAVVL